MPRIKICGVTSSHDALLAANHGADALGFVFAESPRRVSPDLVREISSLLPPSVVTVGVFSGSPLEEVLDMVKFCGLQRVQLHGAISLEDLQRFWQAFWDGRSARSAPGVIQVFTNSSALQQWVEEHESLAVEPFLAGLWYPMLDLPKIELKSESFQKAPDLQGPSDLRKFWEEAAGALREMMGKKGEVGEMARRGGCDIFEPFKGEMRLSIPKRDLSEETCNPLILAGGLTPENVGEAVRIVNPAAVDVCSGVEAFPGKKDERRLRQFIAEAGSGARKDLSGG